MSPASLSFLILLAIALPVYFLIPKKGRTAFLLLAGAVFYAFSPRPWTLVFVLLNIFVTHFSALSMAGCEGGEGRKKAGRLLFWGLFCDIGILAVLKYSGFFIGIWNGLAGFIAPSAVLPVPVFPAPMGISFYTLISAGYLLDCYWGIISPNGSILKTGLFIGFFPQLTSGPITRLPEVEGTLFEGGAFEWKRIIFGAERILFGFFKKFVIASRASILVDAVYGDPEGHPGIYIWTAAFLFMLELYADFSGCMDIILGAAECFGIRLPENFRNPFFSRTVQEFWQRWHITLGVWMRDYVMYPILRSSFVRSLKKRLKGPLGRKGAERAATYFAMAILWFLIGLWHGGGWNYIGEGIYFCCCIIAGDLLSARAHRLWKRLGVDESSFGWHFLQSVKVFLLVAVGNMFFRIQGLRKVFHVMRLGLSVFNPWVLFDGSVPEMGLSHTDINILILGVLLLFAAGWIRERKGSVREWLSRQVLPFRYLLIMGLFYFTLIYGVYGPGFESAAFIYEKF